MSFTKLKNFFGTVVKGAAGWQTYLYVALAGAALVAAAGLWLNNKIDKAFAQGAASQELVQVKQDVTTLKSVIDADKGTADEIANNKELATKAVAAAAELKRLRSNDIKSFDERLQGAADVAVRGYAREAERDIAAVEGSRDGFAAKALQASGAAWGIEDTLQGRRDALGLREDARATRNTLKQPTAEGTSE